MTRQQGTSAAITAVAIGAPVLLAAILAIVNPDQSAGLLAIGALGAAMTGIAAALARTGPSDPADASSHSQRLARALSQDRTEFGFVLIDANDRIAEVNRTLTTIFPDIDVETLPGKKYRQMVEMLVSQGAATPRAMSPEDRIRSQLAWHANPKGPIFCRSPNGRWARYNEVRMADGWVVGLFVDVDTLMRREKELLDHETRLSDYVKAASEWFWETDENDRFTFLSEGFTVRTGQPVERVLGRSRIEMVTDKDSEAARNHLERIHARRPFHDFRYVTNLEPENRRTVSTSGVPVFDEDGTFRGYRGVGRDVSQEVEIERREAAAHRRLADAVNSLRAGMMLFDEDRSLFLTNRPIRDMYREIPDCLQPGLSMETVFDRIAASGQVDDAEGRAAEWRDMMVESLTNPESPPLVMPFGDRLYECRANKTQDGGLIVIQLDVTAQIRHEAELEKAKDEAERANRTKTQFLAQMSHELRTPLNSIIGFSQILHDELYGPMEVPQYKEFAQDISDSGRHLLSIINDILDIAKAESGHSTLSPEPVSVHQAVEATLRLVWQRADTNNITLNRSIDPDVPDIMSEERLLRQMLINLLSNALKFTEPGGEVSVSHSPLPDGGLRLTVADTGIGIAPEDIPRALSPFEQIDSALARRYEGTGLGLPLVKSIMELHGGTMVLESALGVGTSVHLNFPANAIRPRIRTPETPAQAASSS